MFITYFLTAMLFAAFFFAALAANPQTLINPNNDAEGGGHRSVGGSVFFYSINIILSLGYGLLVPGSPAGQTLTVIEQMFGIVINALLISVIVNKASVPLSKLIYSDSAVICPRNGIPHFIFRIGHGRGYFLLNPEVRIFYFRRVATVEGEIAFVGSPMAYDAPPMFSPIVAIAHKIDESSPLYEITPEQMEAENGHVRFFSFLVVF